MEARRAALPWLDAAAWRFGLACVPDGPGRARGAKVHGEWVKLIRKWVWASSAEVTSTGSLGDPPLQRRGRRRG